MWPSIIPSVNVALMFYLLFCVSFAIKPHHYGQDFCFCHKTKHKAADKTFKQRFLKDLFKATCKKSSESS